MKPLESILFSQELATLSYPEPKYLSKSEALNMLASFGEGC